MAFDFRQYFRLTKNHNTHRNVAAFKISRSEIKRMAGETGIDYCLAALKTRYGTAYAHDSSSRGAALAGVRNDEESASAITPRTLHASGAAAWRALLARRCYSS